MGERGPSGAGGGRGAGGGAMARKPALPIALLLLCLRAEAEGAARGPAPAPRSAALRYRMRDVDHKSLYLRDGRLVAGHLQGANAAREEEVFWVPNRAFAPARLPLVMGIRNGSRCLASAPGPRPSLSLQDADIRELPRAGAASAAFTFFRSYRAGLWRFESAANPGWFLCTSARGHEPLGLSRRPDAGTRLDFYFSAAECPERGTAPGDGAPPAAPRDPPPRGRRGAIKLPRAPLPGRGLRGSRRAAAPGLRHRARPGLGRLLPGAGGRWRRRSPGVSRPAPGHGSGDPGAGAGPCAPAL
uniref:Interleukin-1 receptor antagonist protein n=1 Tax=Amazona collaria TaxID=241587 RepID=A0A8B9IWT0_9PSIT